VVRGFLLLNLVDVPPTWGHTIRGDEIKFPIFVRFLKKWYFTSMYVLLP